MMRYIIWDKMDACTEADVLRMEPTVCPVRRAQAAQYRHLLGRWTTLKSYELLCQLFRDEGITAEALRSASWCVSTDGKPYIPGMPHFSLSHCKQGVVVVTDEAEVGVDIETIRPLKQDLIERVMNAREQAEIAASSTPELTFTQLWTQKEAVLKMRGCGITGWQSLRDALEQKDYRLTSVCCSEKNYVMTIAQKNLHI